MQCLQEPFVRSLSSYHFHGATSPFDRRITCLEWHPTHPSTVAVGSKGGDLYLWDYEVPSKKTFIRGVRSYVPLQFTVPPSETTSFPPRRRRGSLPFFLTYLPLLRWESQTRSQAFFIPWMLELVTLLLFEREKKQSSWPEWVFTNPAEASVHFVTSQRAGFRYSLF